MILFLALGLIGMCVAFFCMCRLIRAYKTRNYQAVNFDMITDDQIVGCSLRASVQLFMVDHYINIVRHNAALNQEKGEILCSQFRLVMIVFGLLAVSAIGAGICTGV